MKRFVIYSRVSTDKQGRSGLGLDAQKSDIDGYLTAHGMAIAEFTEVESGKNHRNRPALLAALDACRKHRATLLIARLDRLARNVAFIASLMESGVEFVAVDMPHASKFTIHILAAVAEHERELISKRTKAALAAAKARGIRLGGPDPLAALKKANEARQIRPPAEHVMDLMTDLRASGHSYRQIAREVNKRDIRTPQGFRWHASTIRAALLRARKDESTNSCNDEIVPNTQGLNDPSDPGIPSTIALQPWVRGQLSKETPMQNLNEALRMLDTFSSVGARRFDVTFLNIDGEKRGFRPQQSVMQLSNSLPMLFPGLTERQNSIVIRPHGDDVDFVQLDDLDAAALNRVAPAAFLTLCTSPGNHQAWVAVSGLDDAKDFARRLRKGTGADLSASGATRLAGTVNYKQKYAPSFPTVTLLSAFPGRIVSSERLEELGLVAAQEPAKAAYAAPLPASGNRSWPDYARCVANAPLNQSKTGPDISRADFFFSLMASQRGWSTEEIATRLMELSSKAHENGPEYARITAENAMAAADRGRQRNRA